MIYTVNTSKPYISLFFAAVLAFGVTLSSIHIHIDDFSDVQTEQILVENDIQCVICGSVFKFNPDHQVFTSNQDYPEIYFFSTPVQNVISPFDIFQEGRSPPFLG